MKKIYCFFFLFIVISFLYVIFFVGIEMIKLVILEIYLLIIIEVVSGEEN